MILCVFAMGGGHGTYIPATIVFPYAMLMASYTGKIGAASMVLAALQFTSYAFAIHFIKRTKWIWFAAATIFVLHMVIALFVLNNKGETKTFAHSGQFESAGGFGYNF
jgi:hypothetical protein